MKTSLRNIETQDIAPMPSILQPALLLDVILMKVKQHTIQYTARKKREQNQHQAELESERKTLSDALSRSIQKAEGLKVDLHEKIKKKIFELDMVKTIKNEIKAKSVLAESNLDAEKTTKLFCKTFGKQKKKIRIAHLRRKRRKTPEEEISHPNKDLYDDLQSQEETIAEVSSFYPDLYTNLSYQS